MNHLHQEHAVDLQQSLTFPEDVEVTDFLGEGGRAYVYKARLGQETVVVKVYRRQVVQKYLDKYKVDIAEYEYQRNLALYEIPEIKIYIAKPYRVHPLSGEHSHSFIQECVTGKTLKELIAELGYLPSEILAAGHKIVQQAEAHGVHDLDISVGNIIVNQHDEKWRPKLYDFNLMSQYLFPPNPFMGLAMKLGIRGKSYRDYRSLRNWEKRGKNKIWIGKN